MTTFKPVIRVKCDRRYLGNVMLGLTQRQSYPFHPLLSLSKSVLSLPYSLVLIHIFFLNLTPQIKYKWRGERRDCLMSFYISGAWCNSLNICRIPDVDIKHSVEEEGSGFLDFHLKSQEHMWSSKFPLITHEKYLPWLFPCCKIF